MHRQTWRKTRRCESAMASDLGDALWPPLNLWWVETVSSSRGKDWKHPSLAGGCNWSNYGVEGAKYGSKRRWSDRNRRAMQTWASSREAPETAIDHTYVAVRTMYRDVNWHQCWSGTIPWVSNFETPTFSREASLTQSTGKTWLPKCTGDQTSKFL